MQITTDHCLFFLKEKTKLLLKKALLFFLHRVIFRTKKSFMYSYCMSFSVDLGIIGENNMFEILSGESIAYYVNRKLKNSPDAVLLDRFFSLVKDQLTKNIKKPNHESLIHIKKIAWFIAAIPKNKRYVNLLIEYINNADPSCIYFLHNRDQILAPYYLLGDYRNAFLLALKLRNKYNIIQNRPSGFYNEECHLTAIGHMCLLVYLLQAVDLKYIKCNPHNCTFVYDKKLIANKLLLNHVKKYSRTVDIQLRNKVNVNWDSKIPDNELLIWPNKETNSGMISLASYKILSEIWHKKRSSPPLRLDSDLLKHAELLISQYIHTTWFAGLHFRSAFDRRTLRNSNLDTILRTVSLVKTMGGTPLLLGASKKLASKLKYHALSIDHLFPHRYDKELVHLYIWSQSRFFIGNLSGGSHPPGLFGVPTLWIDMHPALFVTPNVYDIYAPRRIYCIRLARFLQFNEYKQSSHRFAQTEDPDIANIFGYKVLPTLYQSIENAISYLYSKTESQSNIKPPDPLPSRIFM